MILVDTHTHLYACFSTGAFLTWSRKNFETAARNFGTEHFQEVLFCLDATNTRAFPDAHLQNETSDWRFSSTEETVSIRARDGSGRTVFLVTGKQLISRERLEVLALGSREAFPQSVPLKDLIKQVEEAGAIPGVPWGFGKWMGNRGRVLDRVLTETGNRNFFLGDNGGRLGIFPIPSALKKAERRGIPVLRGSDPLPLPSEIRRPGGFGLMIPETLDPERPFEQLQRLIFDEQVPKRDYGRPLSLFSFIKNQFRMAVLKKRLN